ncbi:MAG: glycosyl hydrolase, partial [Flavobacteriia bacterium]
PAFTSGRIADFAVNPDNPSEYYVGVAAGGIWKTTNNGTTFSPVFDKYGVYSIGCLTMDPKNHNVVWAGTGENNHQRSLSYGDGVYKTVDGGKSWKNMGLKESRQIGMIAIDPRDSRIVFVAAEGSVWGPGGDRGLYKTTDGGKTWNKVLNISEHTGVNNVVIDPVNPDVMYATSEQRRRHTHIRIGGGPESNLYKSTDAGETWRKITSGLPNVDKGGMGIAISPVDHNRVYLIVEAAMGKGGFFQSNDQGESWEKMSDYNTSGQYYGEIICHPSDINTIYATETFTKVSHDAGKTWKNLGNNKRHVDDHALWIDPQNNEHLLIGGDGGVYETFDHGKNFIYKSNLPVTQFYRVNVDNDYPFYNVYGGTQDNNSFGGPSQSLFKDGTMRDEWVITLGGDGFWQAIDPMDPNIVYSEYQYGNLYRYDKKSGEKLFIKPMPKAGENTYKWNWDTPFIISLHNHKRLYMVADKVFRSDDRGEHWKVISGDITQNIPRDQWPVMGRYWGVDAVEKNVSTSLYGMGVSLAESPVKEGLLYVGTDDGTIQVKEGNNDWRKITHFSGVPDNTYVTDILPSKFDENVVFATFNNHKRDDFKPYVLMSTNKGKSWRSISGNLPENGSVHTIEQDFINPDLLFVGTEFGVFYSLDKGKKWIQIKGGIPTIAVKDMVIQTRDNDLVLATFGRGFYILDNYSALREWDDNLKQQKAHIFKVEDALLYIPKRRGGSWGSTPYVAKNPEYGAHFTYYLKDKFQSAQDKRRESEKELIKDKQPIPIPSPKELYDEEHEFKPYILFSITDEEGQVIKRLRKPAKKGLGQLHWNLEYSMDYPIKPLKDFNASDDKNDRGIYVLPGKYFIKMDLVNAEGITPLVENTAFNVTLLDHATFPADDAQERADFLAQLKELARVAYGNKALFSELVKKTNSMMKAALESQDVPMSVIKDIQKVQEDLTALKWQMFGEEPKASYEEIKPAEMSVFSRLSSIIYTYNSSNANITQAQKDSYTIIKTQLKDIIKQLKDINEQRMPMIEQSLDRYKSPWTSGRVLEFNE